MAYYTGQVNSFAELKSVIENAAVAAGWMLNDGILSKHGSYVQLLAGEQKDWPFLSIAGATQQLGDTLSGAVGPSAKIYSSPRLVLEWPCAYFIHSFDRELYAFLRSGIDLYLTLTFGVTNTLGIGGTGGWYGGMSSAETDQNHRTANRRVEHRLRLELSVGQVTAGRISGYDTGRLGSPFWASRSSYGTGVSAIHIGLDGERWIDPGGLGISSVAGLLTASPPPLNSGHILLPVKCVVARTGGGVTTVLQHEHIRWIRNDLIEDEAIITFGDERWKCYPVLRKNIELRNGGVNDTHSGTLGYAVRYDGP